VTLQHVVLFRFEPTLERDSADELRGLIADWPQSIGEFTAIHFGTDMHEMGRTRGYDFLMVTHHEDLKSFLRYQDHPIHHEFGYWIREHGGEVLAFDYVLDEVAVIVGS